MDAKKLFREVLTGIRPTAVIFMCMMLGASFIQAGTATIDANTKYQTIRGFGAASVWIGGKITAALADKFWLDDTVNGHVGFTLLRTRIIPTGDGTQAAETNPMSLALARNANILIWSTAWTPPVAYKDNGAIAGGNFNATPANQTAYATWLVNYVKAIKSQKGIDLYAVSPQNEPDLATSYDSCVWTPAQFQVFIRDYMGPAFKSAGLTTKILMPEHSKDNLTMSDATMNDAVAKPFVGIIGGHLYGGGPNALPASYGSVENWETEYSDYATNDPSMTSGLTYAINVHKCLVNASMNAYHFWWLINNNTDNEGLCDTNGNPCKRLYTIGNYSKFIRPGYVRIGATVNPSTNVTCSAYISTSANKYVIIAINQNSSAQSTTFSLNGINSTTAVPWITDASNDLVQQSAVSISGNSFTFSLPASSVMSFVGTISGGPVNTATRTTIPSATRTATMTATRTATNTATRTTTNTATRTNTVVPPTPTFTATQTATKTNTAVIPTATPTYTRTTIPPTFTFTITAVQPTSTSSVVSTVTLTRTSTAVLPTATPTSTRTNTAIPPTATHTSTAMPGTSTSSVVPTSTSSVVPTSTSSVVSTATLTATITNTPATAALVSGIVSPPDTTVANNITVVITVSNTGSADASNVLPSSLITGGTAAASLVSAPSSAETISAGGAVSFTWIYTATKAGSLSFQSNITGTDSGTGGVIASAAGSNMTILSLIPTPTLTPTATLTVILPSPTFTSTSGPVITSITIKLKEADNNNSTNSPHPQFLITNTGTQVIDLNAVEVRYWFNCDCTGQAVQAWVDWAGRQPLGTAITTNVQVTVAATTLGNQSNYLSIKFTGSIKLAPDESIEVQTRFNKTDWSTMLQSNDWSYTNTTTYTDWNKVTGYINGSLVYGQEPAAAQNMLTVSGVLTYPNPTAAGAGATIKYTLAAPSVSPSGAGKDTFISTPDTSVVLSIFTVSGRLIWRKTVEGPANVSTGEHAIYWDGKAGGRLPLAKGIYTLQVEIKVAGISNKAYSRIVMVN